MATTTNNGITLRYPNDPCPVFNPCIFNLTGTLARTRVFVNSGNKSYTAVYQTPNGGTLDLRQFMQVFFDGITLGDDLKQLFGATGEQTETVKKGVEKVDLHSTLDKANDKGGGGGQKNP